MNRWNMIWYIQYRVLAFYKHIFGDLKKACAIKGKEQIKAALCL